MVCRIVRGLNNEYEINVSVASTAHISLTAYSIKKGTMVTGIIGAAHGNTQGVLGVLDGTKVCFVVARVFESMTAQASMSDVLEGIDWAVSEGKAKVINLSLGGPSNSTAAELLYNDIQKQGVLLVAAAGNDGNAGT